SAPSLYPQHVGLKNVRVVGHTPKSQHYVYDMVIDFADGSERVAAKVYRNGKDGADGARAKARAEFVNLEHVYELSEKKKLNGVPRPLGNFTDLGAVVAEKFSGVPLQSIIMKAALLPGFDDERGLNLAAQKTGGWLRPLHKATADVPAPFNIEQVLGKLEETCQHCRKEGL